MAGRIGKLSLLGSLSQSSGRIDQNLIFPLAGTKMLILSLLLTLLLVITAPLGSVFAQQSQKDFAPLEKAALDELRESNTPGAAIAVVSGDRVVYVKGLGLSNVETGTPVEPEMLFRTGSAGKMFTAALLTSLAEEGKIKLDEPIGKLSLSICLHRWSRGPGNLSPGHYQHRRRATEH